MAEAKAKLPVFDPTEALKEALAVLEEAEARFALAGCLAVWTYVAAAGMRLTRDVDFAVRTDDMEAVVEAARKRGLQVEELRMGGYRTRVGDTPVDFIDGRPYLRQLFNFAVEHARSMDLGLGREIPVVRLNYLLAMKAAAAGEQDEQDIGWLLRGVEGAERYRELRSFVLTHAGYTATMVLDKVARRIGHRGPGPEQRS
jgi:predicted nucleotidyltransferase